MSDPNVSSAPPVGNIIPRVFRRDSEVLCNSDDVRKHFGKKHFHVLRDIKTLETHPNLDRSWFRETTILDNYGRPQPAYDMTKDGFTLLVMGWTGQKAMAFKIAYIAEFNRLMSERPKESDLSVEMKLRIVEAYRRSAGSLAATQMLVHLGFPEMPAMRRVLDQGQLALDPITVDWDDAPATDATEVN